MANVSLDSRCRPRVGITIVGPKGEKALEAVIDTGFDGFLCAPSQSLAEIGLPEPDTKITSTFSLADNSRVPVELCMATVRLDDDEQMGLCAIAPADGETLVGITALLSFKKRLVVDVTNDSVELLATTYAQVKQPIAKSQDRVFPLPPKGKAMSIKPPTQL